MDFPQHSRHVLEQLNQQRQLGLLCDCTFVVDGVDFKAHKAVLAACSEYFKMLFVDQKDVVHLDISNAAGTPLAPGGGPPDAAPPSWGRHLRAVGCGRPPRWDPGRGFLPRSGGPVLTGSWVVRGEPTGGARGHVGQAPQE